MSNGRPLTHHDLCFGCGVANLFGLQLEAEARDDGTVRGRFFVKQDHQGPPGFAHGGVIAAALDEAMALAIHAQGTLAVTSHVELDLRAPVPVGAFAELAARVDREDKGRFEVSATLHEPGGGRTYANSRGVFVAVKRPLAPDR